MKKFIKTFISTIIIVSISVLISINSNKELIDKLNFKREKLTAILEKYDFYLTDNSKKFYYYDYRRSGKLEYKNKKNETFRVGIGAENIWYDSELKLNENEIKEAFSLYVNVINDYTKTNIEADDYYETVLTLIDELINNYNNDSLINYDYIENFAGYTMGLYVGVNKKSENNTIELTFGLDAF